jgi:hypothetical protein
MLTPAVALPLLLATALDASSPAPVRPRGVVSPAAVSGAARPEPAPSLESSPRPLEPGLRRSWSAVGCLVLRAGALAPLRGGIAPESARATEDGRVRRIGARGPPRRVS